MIIGSENMEKIVNGGQKLNELDDLKVDTFKKNNIEEYQDYTRIINEPFESLNFKIDQGVIDYIYRKSNGNPYFTKIICNAKALNYSIKIQNSNISKKAVNEGLKSYIETSQAGNFSHFYMDGIGHYTDNHKRDDARTKRQKMLYSYGFLAQEKNNKITKEELLKTFSSDSVYSGTEAKIEADETFNDFERRGIFKLKEKNIIEIIPEILEDYLKQDYVSLGTGIDDFQRQIQSKRRRQNLDLKNEDSKEIIERFRSLKQNKKLSHKSIKEFTDLISDYEFKREYINLIKKTKIITESDIKDGLLQAERDIRGIISPKNITLKEDEALNKNLNISLIFSDFSYSDSKQIKNLLYSSLKVHSTKKIRKLKDYTSNKDETPVFIQPLLDIRTYEE